MTLLVLEMPQPEGVSFSSLLQISHKFIIYVVSFVTLAIYWNHHHHLFQVVKKVNGKFLWANNVFIFLQHSCLLLLLGWEIIFFLVPQLTFGFLLLCADLAYCVLYRTLFLTSDLQKIEGHYENSL